MSVITKLNNAAAASDEAFSLLPALEVILVESNLTKAGLRLGLAQPSVSRILAKARLVFEDPLLIKTGRGMVLTPRAQLLLPELRRAVQSVRELVEVAPEFDAKRLRRVFRIATSDHAQVLLLPRLLEQLAVDAPGVALEVAPIPEDLEIALDRSQDVVITAAVETSSRLRQMVLGRVPMVCVARKGHPAVTSPVTNTTLRSIPRVMVVPTMSMTALARANLQHEEGTQLPSVLRVSSFLVAAGVVSQSDRVCTMDIANAQHLARFFPLQIVPLATSVPKVAVVMYWHERVDQEPAHIWFRGLFKELVAGDMGKRDENTRAAGRKRPRSAR